MKRNYTIDTLRTIATFLVILLHISASFVIEGKENDAYDISFWIGNVIDSFTRICVPLFVLISGLHLVGRKESFKQSYGKRASRILLPIFVWTIIYLMYKAALQYLSSNAIDYKPLFSSLISGKPFYHMWYLYMIIGLYFFAPILNNNISLISRKALWLISVFLLFFGMLNSAYNLFLRNSPSFLLWFIDYLGYFLLGYMFKNSNKNISIITLAIIYLISSVLISILSFYTIKHFDSLYFYSYLSPLVVVASLSFYKIFQQIRLPENILSRISNLTLGIYLIHAGILDVINKSIDKFNFKVFDNPVIEISVKFIIVLLISTLITYMFSQSKYLKRII